MTINGIVKTNFSLLLFTSMIKLVTKAFKICAPIRLHVYSMRRKQIPLSFGQQFELTWANIASSRVPRSQKKTMMRKVTKTPITAIRLYEYKDRIEYPYRRCKSLNSLSILLVIFQSMNFSTKHTNFPNRKE